MNLAVSICCVTSAEEAESKQPTGASAERTDFFDTKSQENIAQAVGSFAPSSTLYGKTVYDEDQIPIGHVDDIILDPYTGMAATLVVEPASAIRRDYRFLIPMKLMTPIRQVRLTVRASAREIADGPSIAEGDKNARPYRRQLARVPFDHYGLEPPWVHATTDGKGELNDNDAFVFTRQLGGTTVVNHQNQKLGVIEDVVISWDNGKIAYAVVTTHDAQEPLAIDHAGSPARHAVPLAAFVVKSEGNQSGRRTWMIEMPESMFGDEHAIASESQLPREINLGWTQYVEQRYGSSMLSGVQRTQQEK